MGVVKTSLLPYLYSAFVKYWKEGIPPIRALIFDYEEDENTRNLDDEYLFGDNLIVAPMTLEDGTSRSVYLPKGKWQNFFEPAGRVYEGGQRYQVDADYDKIPVFVKADCILPLAEPVEMVTKDTVFTIRPRVYGNGGEGFVLYEDDFETFAYTEGGQNIIMLKVDGNGQVQYERIGKEQVRYIFEKDMDGHPKAMI